MLETATCRQARAPAWDFRRDIRPWRRRGLASILVSGGVALVAGACSSGATGSATSTSRPAAHGSAPSNGTGGAVTGGAVTVGTGKAGTLGTVLTAPDGHTLYENTTEHDGKIECTGSCASIWPPLTVPAGESPKLASGLVGTISTVHRPDGTTQVTYDGHPLYYYASDSAPGQANGQGIDGIWFVMSPSGHGPGTTSTTNPRSSTTSTSSPGYSY